jgi:hypothetical protein
MKTSQHTPGPWHNIGDSQIHAQHANQNGLHVATIWAHGVTQTQGNALLIAAAPDLLAALQEADRLLYLAKVGHSKGIDQIRAAIAKALGHQ